MERKQGLLTDIIFHNEDNGYTIAEMETDDELLTVVGVLPSAAVGTFFELKGEFKTHPKYGEQFAFCEAMELMPSSRKGILTFLASGVIRGIGPKMAAAIVSEFGDETMKVIESKPDQLTRVGGIGPKKAKMIAESFTEHREFARIALFFQEYGITSAQALRLYRSYGANAAAAVMENPYRLLDELGGIGFRRADEIAMKMGVEPNSPFRVESGIKYLLSYTAADGSTYVPQDICLERVAQLLDLTREEIYDVLVQMAFKGQVQVDQIDEQKAVFLFAYYAAEQKVATALARLKSAELKPLMTDIDRSIQMTEKASGLALSEKQKEAVRTSIASGVSIITGGPGTGKTTIINSIIQIFRESDLRVSIAAPTGRAAKRITETSGEAASTIHRLLEYYHEEETDAMHFGKTAEDPLDTDVVIVDEASMIDLMLMKALTDAIMPGTRLILVGDSDQLPSVGAGNVLCDMIDSGFVHTSRLQEIYRQAEESMIVVNAHRINRGEYPGINGKDTDFFFMERQREKEMQQLIIDLVTHRLPAYYGDLLGGIDALSDIQVLSPTRRGMVGTGELNRLLQEAFNPPKGERAERSFGDVVYRVGDKVMQIRNNYDLEWKVPGSRETGSGVFNGDVGFITAIDKEDGRLTVKYDERFVQYDFSQLDELELAYAVTVHKSQGSEFPIVVMPVSWFPPMLATRNLLYTAVTRGKRIVVLVGSMNRLCAMIDNDRIGERWSGLRHRLSKLMEFE